MDQQTLQAIQEKLMAMLSWKPMRKLLSQIG